MFRKILVPVDLTEKNRAALAAAAELADERAGVVTLLHVIELIDKAPFDELKPFYKRLEAKSIAEMKELAEPLAAAGIKLDQRITYGKRAREIVTFATSRRFDLIVLSSHPVKPSHPADTWATISYQVAILARCAVLLVK